MKPYTLDAADWPLIINNAIGEVIAQFPLPAAGYEEDARVTLANAVVQFLNLTPQEFK